MKSLGIIYRWKVGKSWVQVLLNNAIGSELEDFQIGEQKSGWKLFIKTLFLPLK